MSYIRVLLKSFFDFFKDDGPMLAGSISYFFIMAIFPFSLFLVSIFGYFLGENRAFHDFLLRELVGFFPEATSKITQELGTIMTYKRIGLLTLVIYGFFSYQLFMALERSVNLIFKQRVKRSFFISVALSLVVITLIIALLISFGATSAISMLKLITRSFPKLVIKTITKILIGFVIPLFLVSLIATSLYLLLPKVRVKIPHALIGGLFTALFLETAKHLFTFYVALNLPHLGSIYGSLSAFVLFVLWVFYSASIFLMGAEIVHNLGNSKSPDHPT
jgi:membrane protein